MDTTPIHINSAIQQTHKANLHALNLGLSSCRDEVGERAHLTQYGIVNFVPGFFFYITPTSDTDRALHGILISGTTDEPFVFDETFELPEFNNRLKTKIKLKSISRLLPPTI